VQITVELLATLEKYAPETVQRPAAGRPFELDVPEPSTITGVLTQLGIPEREVKVAFVDGRARASIFRLAPGAEVGIFPPIGGG